MPDIEFIFDFASPNAYLTHRVLPKRAAAVGVDVTYRPCLLGGVFKLTNNQAPMIAYAQIPAKMDYERLEFARFVATQGLNDFKWNSHFPVTTLLLMRGAIAAQQEGALQAYVEAGMRAMWEDGDNMADPQVYAAALDRYGLDGQHYLAQTQVAEIKAQLAANTDDAVARGVFGIPSFFVGEDLFFGKERLDQVIAAASMSDAAL